MRSFFVYGYGINVEEAEQKRAISFIQNHMHTLIKVLPPKTTNESIEAIGKLTPEYMDRLAKDDDDIMEILRSKDEDLFDSVMSIMGHDDDTPFNAIMSTVTEIISSETGVHFGYEQGQPDECIGGASIMMYQSYPWEMNATEKGLTRELLHEELAPYAEELGLDDRCIGELEVEYFG